MRFTDLALFATGTLALTTAPKPWSIVLAHGAFSRNTTYTDWISAQKAVTPNAKVVVPQLPSAVYPGNEAADPDAYQHDRAAVHKAVVSELEATRDVLLVAHSYGGIPGPDALRSLVAPRRHGGKLLGIVFVSAFVAEKNTSLSQSSPFQPPWVVYHPENVCLP